GYQHAADPVASLQHIVEEAAAKMPQPLPANLQPRELARIGFIAQTAAAFTVALPFNMIFTFGEEFGWRGYLLPRLAPLGGGWAAILTGIVWGLWHAPIIVTQEYNYPGHPWLGVLAMVGLTTALGVVFAWLRFRSGSMWPAALAHAAVNAQAGMGLL